MSHSTEVAEVRKTFVKQTSRDLWAVRATIEEASRTGNLTLLEGALNVLMLIDDMFRIVANSSD